MVSPDVEVCESRAVFERLSQRQQTLRPDAVPADRQPDREAEHLHHQNEELLHIHCYRKTRLNRISVEYWGDICKSEKSNFDMNVFGYKTVLVFQMHIFIFMYL